MAVAWPDFATAGIADAAPFRALADALRERQAAACAASAAHPGAFPILTDADFFAGVPTLRRLREFRDYLCALAPCFVRLEDESYAWRAWTNFPVAYAAEDLLRGAHSLALLPAPGTPERCAAALAVYRDFLAGCAWWLRRFRYVDASAGAYYTRRCRADAERLRENYSDAPDLDYDTGTDPDDAMRAPTVTDLSSPVGARAAAIVCTHESDDEYMSGWRYHGSGPEWVDDYFRDRRDYVSATAYSGLVVRNASGLAGRPLLVPCGSFATDFPKRRTRTYYIETTIPNPRTSTDSHEVSEAASADTAIEAERHGSAWRETRRDVTDYSRQWEYDADTDRWRIRGTEVNAWVTTAWNAAGTRSAETGRGGSQSAVLSGGLGEASDTTVYEADGFGFGTIGVPLARPVIPGHGQAVVIPAATSIPFPDVWDLSDYRLWRRDRRPRDMHRDEVSYRAGLRLCPVLDFNDSYRYQDTTP